MSPKDATVMLRIDAKAKKRIGEAARRRGRSVTDFMLEATMREVEKVETARTAPAAPTKGGACPTFFRALCLTAAAGGPGYEAAGQELTRHIEELAPYDIEDDEWQERLDALEALLRRVDDEPIAAWFKTNLPRCMGLVPARRRRSFVAGVRGFYEHQGSLR